MTAIGILTVLMGLLMLSVGKFIMGGIVMLLAFGIFWTRGGGKFNDRSIYEKVVKTDLGIDELYEKIKDIDTPFGKPWIAVHKGYEGDSIIFGPGKFKDMVAISRVKDSLSIKHLTLIENIIRGEEDEYRFSDLVNTAEAEVTPERYAIFAGFKLAAVMLVMRQGDLWWNDLNWFVREVEKYGARAWVWSDYIRRHPLEEFCKKMPKTVVQNPWTYRATKAKMAGDPLIKIYSTLAEAGYDVAPCGSNCYGVTENFPEMSVYCKATLPAERFKGMIMAPWIKTIAPYRRLHWQAADLMAEAIQRTGL